LPPVTTKRRANGAAWLDLLIRLVTVTYQENPSDV
jgi:hypothetical protein